MLNKEYIEAMKSAAGNPDVVAFAPVEGGIGMVVENWPGYYQVPPYWYSENDFEKAADYANELNKEYLKLNSDEVLKIVASSMRD